MIAGALQRLTEASKISDDDIANMVRRYFGREEDIDSFVKVIEHGNRIDLISNDRNKGYVFIFGHYSEDREYVNIRDELIYDYSELLGRKIFGSFDDPESRTAGFYWSVV